MDREKPSVLDAVAYIVQRRPGTEQLHKVLSPSSCLLVASGVFILFLWREARGIKHFVRGHKTNKGLKPGLRPRYLLLKYPPWGLVFKRGPERLWWQSVQRL